MNTPQNHPLRVALASSHRRNSLMDRLEDVRLEDVRLEDVRLKDAFLALTSGLPRGRASFAGRSTFDNAARAEFPIAPRGRDLRDFLRELMLAAVETGSQQVVRETRVLISRFLGEIQAQVYAVAPTTDTPSLSSATVTAAKETAEALAAIAEAGTTRCLSAIETAHKEADEAIVSLSAFKESSLATLNGRPKMPA
jgi:hypothetical protein